MDRRHDCSLDGAAVSPASALIYDFQLTDFPLTAGEIVDHGALATEPKRHWISRRSALS